MAQTYYTLDEAASVLAMSAEDLDQARKDGLINGELHGGSWRFRSKDVEDYQMMHGPGSVPDLDASGPADGGLPPLDAGGVPTTGAELDDVGSGSDFDLSGEGLIAVPPVTAGTGGSVLKMSPDEMQISAFDDSGEFSSTGSLEAPPPGNSQVSLGTEPLPLAGGTGASSAALGDLPPIDPANAGGASDVRLTLESGSFEFDLTVDSSGRLGGASSPPSTGPRIQPVTGGTSGRIGKSGGDSDVRLDFDSQGGIVDSLISKPDSDVRLEPGSGARAEGGGGKAGGDLMETEEINLDEELRQADLASQARKSPTQVGKSPHTGAKSGKSLLPGLKTQLPGSPTPTMLPTTSPFELSEADLDMPSSLGSSSPGSGGLSSRNLAGDSGVDVGDLSGTGDSGIGMPGASEFELTLAPEDEMAAPPTSRPMSRPRTAPLKMDPDEDVDLGGPLPASDLASNRAELSGINLHKPSDSGRSLEGGGSSDKVDFELTLDDEGVSGPKTLRGKMSDIDSDSEFELTIDEGNSSTSMSGKSSSQKDIFETDSFDMPSEEASASQAVSLEEADTDLESSDFDLALEDGASSDSQELSQSEVQEYDESSMEMEAPRRRSKVSQIGDDSLSGVDSLMDEELTQTTEQSIEEEEAEDEEAMVPTVPSAEADWGIYPLIMMIPCVLIMFLAGLMSYELIHSMWGYHQTTRPSGLIVEGFANLFKGDEPAAPGPAK